MRSLEEFVQQSGSRAKAAVIIGIAETTLWRWMEGKSKPRGLARWRLTELGINWEQKAKTDKIERVVQVRPATEAYAKNDEEMLLGMLSMSASQRVADADALRLRLWSLRRGGGRPRQMRRVARIVRRADAHE